MSSTVERDRTPARPYQQTEQFLEHSNKRAPKTYQISSRADYESSTPTDGPRDMASAAVPIATAVASVAVPLVIEKLQQKFSRGKKFSAKKKPGTTSRGRGDYVDSNSDDVLDTSCVDVERALSDFRQIMLKSTIAQTLSAPHRALLADPSAFSSATDLYHFLYAAYARCLRIKESHSAQPTERSCALCARNSPSYDHALAKCKEFFYANASLTKILLVTVFQCPSILANELMRIVKPPVDPSEGLYAWDVWTIVKEHAKKLNDLIVIF